MPCHSLHCAVLVLLRERQAEYVSRRQMVIEKAILMAGQDCESCAVSRGCRSAVSLDKHTMHDWLLIDCFLGLSNRSFVRKETPAPLYCRHWNRLTSEHVHSVQVPRKHGHHQEVSQSQSSSFSPPRQRGNRKSMTLFSRLPTESFRKQRQQRRTAQKKSSLKRHMSELHTIGSVHR